MYGDQSFLYAGMEVAVDEVMGAKCCRRDRDSASPVWDRAKISDRATAICTIIHGRRAIGPINLHRRRLSRTSRNLRRRNIFNRTSAVIQRR